MCSVPYALCPHSCIMPPDGNSLLESMRRQSELFLAAYAACTATTHQNESLLIAKRHRGDFDDTDDVDGDEDDDDGKPKKKTRCAVVRMDPWGSEIGKQIIECRDAPSEYVTRKWRESFRVPYSTFIMLVQVRTSSFLGPHFLCPNLNHNPNPNPSANPNLRLA